MDEHSSKLDSNPWLQAGRVTFVTLCIFTGFAALRWLVANVREIDPGNRAVVLHLGAVDRVRDAGLLWAWPAPLEEVILVPAAETVLEHQVLGLLRSQRALNADAMAYDDDEGGPVSDALAGSGYLLTGDGAIVQLSLSVFYKVTVPRDYVLQNGTLQDDGPIVYDRTNGFRLGNHVLPALDRLVTRSALKVCAGRDLDTILVARPELLASGKVDADQRERLRSDVLTEVNRALRSLESRGSGLGIEALRIDLQSALPRDTLNAFNAVLTVSQRAEQELAEARSDATRMLQVANQTADRNLQVANAMASEHRARAQSDTADVLFLAAAVRDRTEPDLLQRVYRERMPGILAKAGAVITIDPQSHSQLILPGGKNE